MTRARRTLGLRSSVTLAFALGALALSAALALGTYFSARHYLVEQRERTALRQAYSDAAFLRDNLRTSGAEVSEVLGSMAQPAGTTVLVRRGDQWYASNLEGSMEDATTALRDDVASGSVVVGWSDVTSPPAVVVGIPVASVGVDYYEVAIAQELHDTLATLGLALAVSAAVTTVGGALLGRAASRRVLAPLGQVTHAAVRVSSGDLDTRLPPTDDPDLSGLVGSFNHMVDALHERIEQDARFAADVSHELRTPLTTLTTSLSLLQSASGLPPSSQTAVDLMADELDRFRRALQDLLRLGRLDASVPDSDPVTVPVAEVARQALVATGHAPSILVADDPGPSVRVDRPQLLGAFTNLLDNADRHGGGVVAVRVLDRGELVDVLVEDDGPGVAEADRERVFERFARLGARKSGTGSGLGLGIVERSVRNQDGAVWCTASESGGACFVVRLPVAGRDA